MNNSYLITGGTGSFGKAFIKKLLKTKTRINRLVIFSRDEFKQSEMETKYPRKKFPFIRFFLGDVRDYDRLLFATKNIENIIHAAALKQVPAAEYNPFETIKTNIIGAQNLINAAKTLDSAFDKLSVSDAISLFEYIRDHLLFAWVETDKFEDGFVIFERQKRFNKGNLNILFSKFVNKGI